MNMIATILFVFCSVGFVVCCFTWLKNEITFKNHMKLLCAIERFGQTVDIEECDKVSSLIDHMEAYDKTLWRWWDWGYKNILPKEDFELIKPYIKKRRSKGGNKK